MPNDQILIILPDGPADDEAVELARRARDLGGTETKVAVALLGHQVADAASRLAKFYDRVFVFDDPVLDPPDGEKCRSVLMPLFAREDPFLILIPHSNNAIDLAPGLAVKLGRPLVTDCVEVSINGDRLRATRPVYGGKAYARVTAGRSGAGFVVTVRPGSYGGPPPGQQVNGSDGSAGLIHEETVEISPQPRRRVVETVARESGAVDISQADRIVSVGRGIEDEENLELITSLAESLDAEVACSRPVVDKQWLEKSRQVGTSGVTVRPSLYVAVGISGSFQHLGGIKGQPFLVAINKDPRAPIFDVADVGIVGDLFDIVPLLDEKIRAEKN